MNSLSNSPGRTKRNPNVSAAAKKCLTLCVTNASARPFTAAFKHHLITRIGHLRPPLKVNLDRLARAGQRRKKPVNVAKTQSMNKSLLGPLQYVLVLKKERGCYERRELFSSNKAQNRVTCSSRAPEACSDDRRVQHDTEHAS